MMADLEMNFTPCRRGLRSIVCFGVKVSWEPGL